MVETETVGPFLVLVRKLKWGGHAPPFPLDPLVATPLLINVFIKNTASKSFMSINLFKNKDLKKIFQRKKNANLYIWCERKFKGFKETLNELLQKLYDSKKKRKRYNSEHFKWNNQYKKFNVVKKKYLRVGEKHDCLLTLNCYNVYHNFIPKYLNYLLLIFVRNVRC